MNPSGTLAGGEDRPGGGQVEVAEADRAGSGPDRPESALDHLFRIEKKTNCSSVPVLAADQQQCSMSPQLLGRDGAPVILGNGPLVQDQYNQA